MKAIVYKTTNLANGKFYVGVHTGNDPRYLGSGVRLNRAIRKYGRQNFSRTTLAEFDSVEKAYEFESWLIDKNAVKNENIYNMRLGGKGGWEHVDSSGDNNCMKRPEIVKKMVKTNRERHSYTKQSEILKQYRHDPTGSKHSEETKKKISKGNKESWAKNKDRHIYSIRKCRYVYVLRDPDGIEYNLGQGELSEFCQRRNLNISSFSQKEAGNIIKKGRAKNWTILKKERRN